MTAERSRLGLGFGLSIPSSFCSSAGLHGQDYSNSTARSRAGIDTLGSLENKWPVSSAAIEEVPATQCATQVTNAPELAQMSSYDETQILPEEVPDISFTHFLNLARCRVMSEPVSNSSADANTGVLYSTLPRTDSLLQLGSDTASTDLKKLLNTRVRQAPSPINTEKANLNGSGFSSASNSPIKEGPRSSRLETEKSRARVEIYFGLNNHTTVEGGYIGGMITVRIRTPRRGEARHVRIDGGRVRILGYEGISESERYAFYQCSSPLPETTEGYNQIVQSQPDSDGFRVAREGTFTFPFKMHLPPPDVRRSDKNVPKGIIQDGSVGAAIRYILLVSFKVRDDLDNTFGLDKRAGLTPSKTSIAHFYRHVEVWPTYGPMALHPSEGACSAMGDSGTVSSRTAQSLLFGGTGMLHLTAVLHRKVWIAGQKCAVYIGAWNETRKFVKSLSLAIIRKSTITRTNQNETTSHKQIAEATLDAVRGPSFGSITGKGWWTGVDPGSSCEFSHVIGIPMDALTIPRTHVIEVSYVLRVSLITGSLSHNVSVDLPFTIINAFSTDGLPVPPPAGLLTGSLKLPKDVPISFLFEASHAANTEKNDLQSWVFPRGSPPEVSTLPRDYILDWTQRTSANAPDDTGVGPTKLDLTKEANLFQGELRAFPELCDTSTSSGSVTHLITQLESDIERDGNIIEPSHAHRSIPSVDYVHQRTLELSSSSKPAPSRHRVTFLTPTQSSVSKAGRNLQESINGPGRVQFDAITDPMCSRTSMRKSSSRSGEILVKADVQIPQNKDIWSSDDADAILESIRMDNHGFDSYELGSHNYGQEAIVDRTLTGFRTASTLSSEPWSTSAASTRDYQSVTSADHPSFETQGKTERLIPLPRPATISLGPRLQCHHAQDPELTSEDTPRAGVVPRFQPEIISGSVQVSASRAALIPTISSPMLAKSQSAHVAGSPVNQYRRFLPQQTITAFRPGDTARSVSYLSPEEKRTINVGRAPWKTKWDQSATLIPYHSAEAGSSSRPSDSRIKHIHLRSRSTSQPQDEPNHNAPTSQGTVRSRIAALEERSRSRPFSAYS